MGFSQRHRGGGGGWGDGRGWLGRESLWPGDRAGVKERAGGGKQMVAGERVTGAASAWMLAGKGYEYYANFLALAMWCFEGETPACSRCRVRAEREEWRRWNPL